MNTFCQVSNFFTTTFTKSIILFRWQFAVIREWILFVKWAIFSPLPSPNQLYCLDDNLPCSIKLYQEPGNDMHDRKKGGIELSLNKHLYVKRHAYIWFQCYSSINIVTHFRKHNGFFFAFPWHKSNIPCFFLLFRWLQDNLVLYNFSHSLLQHEQFSLTHCSKLNSAVLLDLYACLISVNGCIAQTLLTRFFQK